MSKQKSKQDAGITTGQVWLFTGVAVALILVVAIVVSVAMRGKGSAGHEEAVPVATVTENAPAPQAVTQAPVKPVPPAATTKPAEEIAGLTPVEPARPAVTDTRPKLLLDNLAGTLSVTTTVAPSGERLDLEHTCYRMGLSLPVLWQGAPSRTKTYVLVMEERKANEEPFVKWLVYNIPVATKGLPKGLPQAEAFEGGIRQGRNDHGSPGYTGPCIPQGRINYALRLFALDTELTPVAKAKLVDLIPAMNGHIIDAAEYKFQHYLNQ